jgi:hypothetical protein
MSLRRATNATQARARKEQTHMRTAIAAFTLAAVTSILLPSCVWASPTEVGVRVEGQSETFFEGPILTEGHDVASATGNTEEHLCNGMNNKAHTTPGPTPTAAGADAMSIVGETFSGQWYPGYDDFLITRWGPESEGEDAWHLVVNNVFTSIGGCQYELAAGDEVLWVYKEAGTEPLLALLPAADAYTSGPRPSTATATLNQPFEVEVLEYPDNAEDKPPAAPERAGSSPLAGAEVVPVETSVKGFETVAGGDLADTGAAGRASITFTTSGWHRIRAISVYEGREVAIRSNRLDVCVPAKGLSGCGPLEPEDDVRAASRTPEELKREEEAKQVEEAKYAEEVKLHDEQVQREEEEQKSSTGPPAESEVLSFHAKDSEVPPAEGAPLRVQAPVIDSQGAARGLIGVSWRILEAGVGLRSWTIASKALGSASAGYVTRATGTSATSALVALPPGGAYDLQITFTDTLGRNSTIAIGKALVPLDDRWSGLHYRGRWRRMEQAGAWLGTVSRGGAGAQATATLAAGRPVFVLRGAPGTAKVEVREGSSRQVFTLAHISGSASRLVTGATRSRSGTVSLRVLHGTVDLDGVAVEG